MAAPVLMKVVEDSPVKHLRGACVWVFPDEYRKTKTMDGEDVMCRLKDLRELEAPPEDSTFVVCYTPVGAKTPATASQTPEAAQAKTEVLEPAVPRGMPAKPKFKWAAKGKAKSAPPPSPTPAVKTASPPSPTSAAKTEEPPPASPRLASPVPPVSSDDYTYSEEEAKSDNGEPGSPKNEQSDNGEPGSPKSEQGDNGEPGSPRSPSPKSRSRSRSRSRSCSSRLRASTRGGRRRRRRRSGRWGPGKTGPWVPKQLIVPEPPRTPHPPTKTTLCRFWLQHRCERGIWCAHAHGAAELGATIPPIPPGRLRQQCRLWRKGVCKNGENCPWVHDQLPPYHEEL